MSYDPNALLAVQLKAVLRNCSSSEYVTANSALKALQREDERALKVYMRLLALLLPGFHFWL